MYHDLFRQKKKHIGENMNNIPSDLKYYEQHEWMKELADGTVLVGISDYAQYTLTDITYVNIKAKVGEKVEYGKIFGDVDSVKSVSDLFSPVSGTVIEVNNKLVDEPELINNDPYGKGWMIKVKPSQLKEEKSKLMDSKKYQAFIEDH